MESELKFLIVRLGAIGDIVHSLPVVDCIKKYYPNARVDWVVGDKFKGLIENNPLVDNTYVFNLSKFRKNWLSPFAAKEIIKFNRTLSKNKYDYVIDTHGMFKSAIVTGFSGGKKRIGYKDYRELATLALNTLVEPKSKRPHKNYHMIKRNLDLLVGGGIITQEQLDEYAPQAALPPSNKFTVEKIDFLTKSLDETRPMVVFAPATTWVNKHWNVKNWQELYEMLRNDANIVFTGSDSDKTLINEIVQGDCENLILAGETNLEEYIEVLRRATVIVSPDSGASHLGFALNKIIVTIFCATSKETYRPLGKYDVAFPIQNSVCDPCHKRKCRKKTMDCTFQTEPEAVYQAVCNFLH